MKSIFTLSVIIAGFVLFALNASAQTSDSLDYVQPFSKGSSFRTLSVGLFGGASVPFSLDYYNTGYQAIYGGYIKEQILSTLGVQGDFFAGKVEGYNSITGQFSKYLTTINYAVDLSAEITLANINWRHKKGFIQPYVIAGFGSIVYKPELTTAGANPVTYAFKNNNGSIQSFYVPVGGGVKFDISREINLDLGYRAIFIGADNFDGLNNGNQNDRFSYAFIGLEFALGNLKKPQLATHNPVNSMRTEYLMIEDRLELELAAQKAQNDKLKNDLNSAKNDLNSVNANLLRLTSDSDGDGVPDFYDKCPNTPVGTKVDGSGCSLVVGNSQPNVNVYVTEEDKKVVKDAITKLEFELGKATIKQSSYEGLDRVAQLLIDKNLNIKLSGYTDNTGSPELNLKLSKERAEAVKTYLVSKGVDAAHVKALGFGKTNPIATNSTAAGRQLNRRVEFTIY